MKSSFHRNLFLLSSLLVLLLLSAGVLLSADAQQRKERGKTPRKPRDVTFSQDIAPILYKYCVDCHRQGDAGPFPLVTYDDARKRSKQIALVVERGQMPPSKADPSWGRYHDARYLSKTELATIKRWAATGAKPGDLNKAPKPPRAAIGWRLGEPDVTLTVSEPFNVPAEGNDVYRCFVLPTQFKEDRYLSAVEFKPGNRSIVHHVIAFLDTNGRARRLDARSPGPGYPTFGGVGFVPTGALGGWAPGNFARHLADGIGIQLPKGADIVLQVHYSPSGKPETDQTRIGLHFAKKPVDKRLRVATLVQPFLSIPPGEANHTVTTQIEVPGNVTVHQVMPHMHLVGKEIKVWATRPGGATQRLVRIPEWDFNWQATYSFIEPIRLTRGSKVELAATYDNSENNPRNPNSPPKRVTWGEQTTDEMALAFLFYTVDEEQLTKGIEAPNFSDMPLFGF